MTAFTRLNTGSLLRERLQGVLDEMGPYRSKFAPLALDNVERPQEITCRLRDHFKKAARDSFLIWAMSRYKSEMADFLGVDKSILNPNLACRQTPHIRARRANTAVWNYLSQISGGVLTGYSVDHIVPLYLGGDNSPQNMCLMPARINELKELFERVQRDLKPNSPKIVTLAPRKNVDGDYQRFLHA